MNERPAPKISIIIAAFSPGDAVHRVIDSLDAQTLPQNEFEVIFVDDGSPDDTFDRLDRIAATRPNMVVWRIQNSGWPSRPRNLGIEFARGEYLMFMDHDDSLFPDGLRRAYEYAVANDADIVSPKESKTNDSWWGLSSLTEGNIANILVDGGVERLLPMVPHKLYRRQMFLEQDIRFPEGARMLWEDIYINVAAYRHAKVVSVLADSPVYLWHASADNSSHTFDPVQLDFWERLADVMEFISTTLDAPGYRQARARVMAHQVRGRVIDRFIRMLNDRATKPAEAEVALSFAQRLLEQYGTDDVLDCMPKKHLAQAVLLRAGRPDLMKAFYLADLSMKSSTVAHRLRWKNGTLRIELENVWEPKTAAKPGLHRLGERVYRAVSPELEQAIPDELLDVTDDVRELRLDLNIRRRRQHVSWIVPFHLEDAEYTTNSAGVMVCVGRGEAEIDLATGAVGAPLADDVWDLRVKMSWGGMVRKGYPQYAGPARPGLIDGRPAVAYGNARHAVSLDLDGSQRTLVIDAKPRGEAGPVGSFQATLKNIGVHGASIFDASTVVAIPADAVPPRPVSAQNMVQLEALAEVGNLHARVVADSSAACLEGSAALSAGDYVLFARRRGVLHQTPATIKVGEDGLVEFPSTKPHPPAKPKPVAEVNPPAKPKPLAAAILPAPH